MELYTITHKKYRYPTERIYIPIVAGSAEYSEFNFPSNYLRDDVCDNISNMHDLYSEYTINYWIWKNSKADVVGINHYRRYFIRGNWLTYLRCILNSSKQINKFRINDNDINTIFNKGYNCIVPKKQWRVNRTMRQEFDEANSPELLDATETIIQKKYKKYTKDFERVFGSLENHQKCICIMSKPLFDEYSEWIFGIYSELIEMGYTGHNREFAFLGERLMNVWLEYNKRIKRIHAKELFFVNVEFSLKDIKRNYTEIILPKFLRNILRIIAKLKIEIVTGDGSFRIRRKEKN